MSISIKAHYEKNKVGKEDREWYQVGREYNVFVKVFKEEFSELVM